MKTALDAVDIVWKKIYGSALKTEITGKVYKHRKPAGSDKEDVVVNCPTINNTQLQQGLVNVNIYVPNIPITIAGIADDSQPDHARLKELATMAVGILDDSWGTDYSFDVQQPLMLMDEQTKEHFLNIRLNFYSINISN